MDQDLLRRALAALPLGPILYFDRIGSTNTEAAALADQGAPDLTLVVADEQTAGRGRQGRRWFTPPGAALAFSLVLRPAAFLPASALSGEEVLAVGEAGKQAALLDLPALLGRLTALGALAVCQALQEDFGLAPRIKWPNDVLLERRKVCGVLAEAHWNGAGLAAVVLGIGVNVTADAVPPAAELIYPATALELVGSPGIDRPTLLRQVLQHLLDWRDRLVTPDFWLAWDDRLAFKGEWVWVGPGMASAGPPAQASYPAQVLGLHPSGYLRVRVETGAEILLHTGELQIRPQDWVQ